jgi:hypothetical protein
VGAKPWSAEMYFGVPKEQEEYLVAHKKEGSAYVIKDGQILGRVATIWFTNLDIAKRHEKLILWKNYTSEEYPTYDNYDAINVDEVDKIPVDYDGVMGVPVTFLDKYNPDQFDIIGLVNGKDNLAGLKTTRDYKDFAETKQDDSKTGSSGKKINGNPVLIGKPDKGNYFVLDTEIVHSKYARIFIKKK